MQTTLAIALGLLLSLGPGQLLTKMLYEVSPSDPAALTVSAGLLAIAALIACFLPARRATRISPLAALRSE